MADGKRVYDNILEVIGNTPMVKINRVHKDHGLECDFYAKCEFLNPGGSIKDRICRTMVLDAEKKGLAKPGVTSFVEPTSGNTGIGMALASAVRGYGCTIVTPDKNSDEKMDAIRLLGSTIVQTPACAHADSSEHFLAVTKKLLNENPNAMSLDQYKNKVNPKTHYETTAEEILNQVGIPDMVVMGAGTGGTVVGVAKRLKEASKNCTIVAVDPQGSIMFNGEKESELYHVEGIGGDFVPAVLDKKNIDIIEKPNDFDAFNMSRELIRKEGLLCGGSSGAAMISAIRACKNQGLGAGKRVVVILPDGIRNYMTKFVSDQWMEAFLYKEPPLRNFTWWEDSISKLQKRDVPSVTENVSCLEAFDAMGSEHSVALVVDDNGYFRGAISKDSLRSDITNPKKEKVDLSEPVKTHLIKKCYKIMENKGKPTVGLVSRMLDITPFVVIVKYIDNANKNSRYIPKGIITTDEVLSYVTKHKTIH